MSDRPMADQADTTASSPLPDMLEESRRIVALAEQRHVRARLAGGMAVLSHAHAPLPATVERLYGDIDVVVPRREGRTIEAVLLDAGYEPNTRFNAMHGGDRLEFIDTPNGRHVDVFVGRFDMCHSIDLDGRLPDRGITLTLADLLLTKLQIVELNQKDIVDSLTVLRDHELSEGPGDETIDVLALEEVCANDWGWYTTVTDNLQKLHRAAENILADDDGEAVARERIDAITDRLAGAKKSRRWKMRSKVGRRAQWYELPEET